MKNEIKIFNSDNCVRDNDQNRAFKQFTNVHSDVTEREDNSNNHAPRS